MWCEGGISMHSLANNLTDSSSHIHDMCVLELTETRLGWEPLVPCR